jgi:hypothetical protein
MYNWNTLNAKVLHRLGFSIPKQHCEAAARAAPMAIEKVLKYMRYKFSELVEQENHTQVRQSRPYYNLGLSLSLNPCQGEHSNTC